MRCHKCKRKIKSGYKWLGKIWCYRCFCAERDKHMDNYEIDWYYKMVQDETQKTLGVFMV